MNELCRIGIAIDAALLARFDQRIRRRGYANRSEAFRDMIRDDLIEENAEIPSKPVVGTLTIVYDHHVRMLTDRLLDMQHEHHDAIISSLHVHLDHDNCLEVLVLRGKSTDVRTIADKLISTRGVRHGRLTLTTSETQEDKK
jgi:CopG family nickel-responsive transcriptional regulator